MSAIAKQDTACGGIPHQHGGVVAARGDTCAVGRPGEPIDGARISKETHLHPAVGDRAVGVAVARSSPRCASVEKSHANLAAPAKAVRAPAITDWRER